MAKIKKLIVDVDKVIASYNKNNPGKDKMTQLVLAKELGVSNQVLSNWKSDRIQTNKMVLNLDKLAEIGQCPIAHFITDVEVSEEDYESYKLEIENGEVWSCSLYSQNDSKTAVRFEDRVHAPSFQQLVVEIGNKNWLDLMKKNF